MAFTRIIASLVARNFNNEIFGKVTDTNYCVHSKITVY